MNDQEILAKLKDDLEYPCNSMNQCQPCQNCKDDKRKIIVRMEEKHTYHCACRFVWGDGQCECELKGIVPGPISRQILA